MSKYIKVDDLQAYCDNQIDHSITPNVFQRMNHYEFPETDFECLKRIFTKAKLVTAFDEYEGMFDNKIIVFLNGNELHLYFDKNTEEIKEADKSQID